MSANNMRIAAAGVLIAVCGSWLLMQLAESVEARLTPPQVTLPQGKDLPYGMYAAWNSEDLPAVPSPDAELPKPSFSAVCIGDGFMLAPLAGMGDIAYDFGKDPTVRWLDRGEWAEGRFIDVDLTDEENGHVGTDVAIIRLERPCTPAPIAPVDARAETVAELLMSSQGDLRVRRSRINPTSMCRVSSREVSIADVSMGRAHCYQQPVRGASGAVFLDAQGNVVGIQTRETDSVFAFGLGLSPLRQYLERYAMSWGQHLRVKPHL